MQSLRLIFATTAIVVGALINSSVSAKAPVWKVSKDDQTFYVGGTIHLLSAKDYPLPDAFQTAFEIADIVVFETDVDSATSLATQAQFMSVLMLPAGQTIETRIKPETYNALKAFLDERQLPLAMFERMTPAGLNLTLVVMELQRFGITGADGVETHMNAKAKETQKEVEWLESISEQVSFIQKMNDLDADKLILSTIRDTKSLADDWPKLLAAWKAGDLSGLEDLGINRMLQDAPAMYDFILADRNKDWMPDIRAFAATPEIEFIMVGALHLAGEDSVLSMLESEGYKIVQLD